MRAVVLADMAERARRHLVAPDVRAQETPWKGAADAARLIAHVQAVQGAGVHGRRHIAVPMSSDDHHRFWFESLRIDVKGVRTGLAPVLY